MKKIILLILLIPSLLFAGALQQKHKAVIARQTVASGGGITHVNTTAFTDTGETAGHTYKYTYSSGTNKLLFIITGCTTCQDDGVDLPSTGVTYDGETLTEVWQIDGGGTLNAGFLLKNDDFPISAGEYDVVITFGSAKGRNVTVVSEFTGVHQTTSIGTPNEIADYDTTKGMNVVAASTDDLVIIGTSMYDQAITSYSSGQTELDSGTASGHSGSNSTKAGVNGNVSVSSTSGSNTWISIGGVALKPTD